MDNKVEVLWIARYDYSTGWGTKRHSHDFYQMYYVLSGLPEYSYNDISYELAEDMYLMILPNVTHGMRKIEKDSIKIIDIKFYVHDDLLKEQLLKLSGPNKSDDSILRTYLEKIREEGKHKNLYYSQVANIFLEYILLSAIRGKGTITADTPNTSCRSIQDTHGITKMVIEYIDMNYMEDISLYVLSQTFGYNKNYICQKFTEETGCTIRQHLNQLRVKKAKELMSFSNYDLKQISSLVGFDNVHYFSTVFKNLTGFTPGLYRERELQELRKGIFLDDKYINVDYHDV